MLCQPAHSVLKYALGKDAHVFPSLEDLFYDIMRELWVTLDSDESVLPIHALVGTFFCRRKLPDARWKVGDDVLMHLVYALAYR